MLTRSGVLSERASPVAGMGLTHAVYCSACLGSVHESTCLKPPGPTVHGAQVQLRDMLKTSTQVVEVHHPWEKTK